ncbi:OLC1v1014543C1 [Oldenlandia corymbosa var. corymbosa]|uniref:OLC1v1014543C1 n=1 Tax=Oldenlandia corymbosa var. corymbosa TaxID=529605 RepID=A0AAV1E128_OLDCO|nr:OLC1v1014543C1 [Oldenlandia corymbosa var. corymbosa]
MAAAVAFGSVRTSSSWIQFKNSSKKKGKVDGKNSSKFRVSCVYSSVRDPYRTLRIHRGASEAEVKKAFRQLALQYHPDVCKENDSGVQFHQITEAYEMVMDDLRAESEPVEPQRQAYDEGIDDTFRGMFDPDWDLWEEWMGWEGAGIRDYTSHINPYI